LEAKILTGTLAADYALVVQSAHPRQRIGRTYKKEKYP